jgi:hypothetical protein
VPAERQPGVDPVLDRLDPLRGKAFHLVVQVVRDGQAVQYRPTPEADGQLQAVGGDFRPAGGKFAAALLEQRVEAQRIELIGRDAQGVAALPGLDARSLTVGGADQAAQFGDVSAEVGRRRGRRAAAPQPVGEAVDGHWDVRPKGQDAEHQARHAAARRRRAVDPQRTQHAQFHRTPADVRRCVRWRQIIRPGGNALP